MRVRHNVGSDPCTQLPYVFLGVGGSGEKKRWTSAGAGGEGGG